MRVRITLLLLALQSSGMAWRPQGKDVSQAAALRSATPEDLASKLSKRVTNYNLGASSLVGALIRVSNDFQIPMGIAWVDSPAARAYLPFAWKDSTPQDIIKAIAKTQPGYQVQVSNGVVHVFPLIPDAQNFLKMKIGDFSVHNTYAELAYFKLHTLVTPPRHGNQQISIAGPGDSRVNVELKNPTVEVALDALAVTSSRKVWIVTFSNDTSLTARGFRRTKTLWTEKPIPDEEQPGWDLIRWGDPVPPAIAQARK